jgi:hypothetical protein
MYHRLVSEDAQTIHAKECPDCNNPTICPFYRWIVKTKRVLEYTQRLVTEFSSLCVLIQSIHRQYQHHSRQCKQTQKLTTDACKQRTRPLYCHWCKQIWNHIRKCKLTNQTIYLCNNHISLDFSKELQV